MVAKVARKITPEQVEQVLIEEHPILYNLLTKQDYCTFTKTLEYLTALVNDFVTTNNKATAKKVVEALNKPYAELGSISEVIVEQVLEKAQ